MILASLPLVAEDMLEVLCGYHLSVLEPGPDLDVRLPRMALPGRAAQRPIQARSERRHSLRARSIPDEERLHRASPASTRSGGLRGFWMRRRRGSTG